MKKTKQILSLLICIAIVLNFAAVIGVSAQDSTYANEDLSSIVKSLGIDIKVSETDENVTYIDFLKTIASVMNRPLRGMSDSNFVDYMLQSKYVHNADVFRIKPTDMIPYGEALYSIVRMLGFEYEAEYFGGYPSGYYRIAVQCGLTDGLSGKVLTEQLTGAETVQLAYNTLLAPFKSNYDHTKVSDEYQSVLEEFYDVYYFEGIVNATAISGLYSPIGATGGNQIAIDGITYDASGFNTMELLGYAVKGFYIQEPFGERIISIEPDETENDELVIAARDIDPSTTANQIVYNDKNGKKRTVTLAADVVVIYNGEAYPGFDADTFKISTGELHLVKHGGSTYTAVQVWDYESFWVRYFDIDEYTVHDFYGKSRELQEAVDEKLIDITDTEGNDKYATDFMAYQVLWIAEAPESGYVKIIMSTDSVSGKIESIANGDVQVVTINGEEYNTSANYKTFSSRYKVDLEIGLTGSFYLDPAGEIFAAKKDASEGVNAGYVIAAVQDDDEIVKVKMLNEYGEIVTYNCAEKVKIDSASGQKPEKVLEKLQDSANEFEVSAIKRQLVLYNLNTDGEISMVDFAYKNEPESGESYNSLRLLYNYSTDNNGKTLFYRSSAKTFGGRVAYSAAALQMQVAPKNSDGKDVEEYFVTTGLFKDEKYYMLEAYAVGDRLEPEYLISYPSGEDVADSATIVYEGTRTKYDSETMEIYEIVCGWIMSYNNDESSYREFILKGDYSMPDTVDKGDLINLSLNWKEEVVGCETRYDFDKKDFIYKNTNYQQDTSWGAKNNMMLISPIYGDGAFLKCALGPDPTDESLGVYIINPSAFGEIIIYDSSERYPISLGSLSDIPTYENEPGTECTIIYNSYWGTTKGIVVYK